jgi:RNA polymerase sigma factor (sigma-70 family)
MKDVIKSEATLVLNKIAKDPNKWRGKFSTFAVACMRNRVIDCLRKKRIRFESTDNEEWFAEDEKLPKHSFDFKEEIDSFDISTLNFGVLSDFEREVIFLRCNDGISFDDIASLLGSYKMKIHRTYKEACLKLRLLTSDNNS